MNTLLRARVLLFEWHIIRFDHCCAIVFLFRLVLLVMIQHEIQCSARVLLKPVALENILHSISFGWPFTYAINNINALSCITRNDAKVRVRGLKSLCGRQLEIESPKKFHTGKKDARTKVLGFKSLVNS